MEARLWVPVMTFHCKELKLKGNSNLIGELVRHVLKSAHCFELQREGKLTIMLRLSSFRLKRMFLSKLLHCLGHDGGTAQGGKGPGKGLFSPRWKQGISISNQRPPTSK